MRKPGTDPDNVRMSDVVCDFCGAEWSDVLPMVEGHQGSCICGGCVTAAYREVVLGGRSTAPAGSTCRLCLEQRKDRAWAGPSGAVACERCIKQSAGVLSKDKDYGWTKPTA
jgi:hypothetical protein